jgi:hypothetical protein
MDQQGFSTSNLPLAAFVRCRGYEPEPGALDSSGILEVTFRGDPQALQELAREFLRGGTVPALQYHHTLNELRGIVRIARAGVR